MLCTHNGSVELAYELSGPPAEDAKLMLRGLQCGGRPLSTVELPLGSPRPYLPPPSDPEAVQAIPLGEP